MAVKTIHVLVASITILIVVAALVYYFYSPSQKPLEIKVVTYAYNDRITGIDPSLEDDTGLVVLGSIYETLTYYDYKTQEVKPRLAVNWTHNEDGTEWTFYLRRGVVFHDGTPFNATAVKISVERARDLYRKTGRGLGYIWDAVEEVIVIDEYTVKFRLSYPQRLDLLASAAYGAYIFSPSVLEKSGVSDYMDKRLEEWFNMGNAIGTGPYKLVAYDPMREVRLEKFKEWWGWDLVRNENAPDVVIIKIVTEPESQYNGLLSREIDIASSVPRRTVSELISKGFRVINLSTYHNFVLFFNVKRYPTNIREFREAIAYAINQARVISEVLLGFGRPASGVIPYGFPGHFEDFKYEYNLEKARELLKKSGVELPVKIELLYQVDYEETRSFAKIFEATMRELGIEVELNPQDWARLKDIARGVWEDPENTPHLIIADWWPTIPSPYDYLYTMFHSESKEWNFAGYENPELDKLIDTAWELEGSNYTEAMNMYRQAQEIIYNDVVAIGLWDEIRPYIYSTRVDVPEEALNPLYTFVIRFELVKVRS